MTAITKRMKIGRIVLCNSYPHLSLLAKMLPTLNIINKGGVELGIEAGLFKQNIKNIRLCSLKLQFFIMKIYKQI